MDEANIVWTCGDIACFVVHHPGAESHEVQVRKDGVVMVRRWFENANDAAQFSLDVSGEFDLDLMPVI